MTRRSNRSATLWALAVLVAIGTACLLVNWNQPLVRNGLVYARATEHVIEHGFNPLPVVADSKLSYDKPIGFAWLGSFPVALLGTHRGLMLMSFAGTLCYLLATWFFTRAYDPLHLRDRERALALLFAGLCPIVAYQFWSAHPDSLFASLYLVAFGLSARIVARPSVGRVALLFATIFASLVLKNYGMILLPSCALYFLLHRKHILGAENGKRVAATIVLALGLLSVAVILGRAGLNPLMRIEGEGGGAGQYGRGSWARACWGTWVQVGVTLLVNVHVALPLILCTRTGRARAGRAVDDEPQGLLPALLCFPLPYVLGLMLFPTTFYNMRYFIPLLPFAALLAVSGLRACGARLQTIVPYAFTGVALLLVAVFDIPPLYSIVGPRLPRLEVNWIGVPLSLLDNLRMPLHLKQAAILDNLNAQVERDGLVYLLDFNYYGDAQRGVYERAGLIRKDVHTVYADSREFAPMEADYYVLGPVRDPTLLPRLGKAADLGLGLYRIESKIGAASSVEDSKGER